MASFTSDLNLKACLKLKLDLWAQSRRAVLGRLSRHVLLLKSGHLPSSLPPELSSPGEIKTQPHASLIYGALGSLATSAEVPKCQLKF